MTTQEFAQQYPELAAQGYFPPVDGQEHTYVLMVVSDLLQTMSVGLLKKKGPAHLLGKITFPGGRREAGETVQQAASREMREETGLVIPQRNWIHLASTQSMALLFAQDPHVLAARTCEDEEVFPLMNVRQLEYSLRSPDRYAPDFNAILKAQQTLFSQRS